ncbi:TonB-dependent receptor [Caulobacter hibisci]|uniref:TonB-dependent receptor n=1 Tax=Caulobacter hibisci TaxID=2035993 RepID=A0ABS0SUN4_9CAUL|nr:TonB-dependent receptor [Caulobacter hibisci]MBI1683321.1 TonB-dependent receptor [Caulobacter hibisci]
MNRTKLACLATTALFGGLRSAAGAYAQSTATTELDAVVVTAATGPKTIDGAMVAETAPKSKYTITNEYLSRQADGQTILQSLNLVPGVVFSNSDPYGSSGGTIRLHGQDGAHIGFLLDGVPLNDGGNYAIYSNQQMDPEVISQANVNTGSTDADSVTASSTAGVINYTTLKATKDAGVVMKAGLGTDNYRRVFALVQTGEFGPLGTRAWVSGSYQKYDKFKGPGDLEKKQFNARIEQDLVKPGDFVALSLNYNENRNASYYGAYLPSTLGSTSTASYAGDVDTYGADYDYPTTYVAGTATAGSTDTANSGNTNYYGIKINPSNTGTIRGQSRYTILPNLKLTVDPSFNYTLANGGGATNLSETNIVLKSDASAGVDLNGDGDTKDTVTVYSPSNTNTRRYDLNTSLVWDINDHHRVRISYAYDEAHTRQTGEYSLLNSDGSPGDVFGGKDGYGNAILNGDGEVVQKRNRASVATFKQLSVEYRGEFLDERLIANIGVRAPTLDRELNQYCYSFAGSSSTAYCTSLNPTSTAAKADGAVASKVVVNGTTYFSPFSATKSYDAVLPNVGLSYKLANAHTVYASYSEQMSAPKVDNLYALTATGALGDADPETGQTFELGYRFRIPAVMASASIYHTAIQNRIVSTVNPDDTSTYIDRNVGDVEIQGFDGQVQWKVDDKMTAYASVAYTDAQLQDNLYTCSTIVTGTTSAKTCANIATAGKQVVETPKWTFGGRLTYDFGKFQVGLQGKFVGDRYMTDVNDQKVDSYTVFDADIRYDLGGDGWKKSYIQLNVNNIFDEFYYGNLAGTQTSAMQNTIGYARTYAYIGAPRSAILSLKTAF